MLDRILVQDKQKIDNIFFTCVALMNMLHEWDGLGEWNAPFDGEVEGEDAAYWQDLNTEGVLEIVQGHLAFNSPLRGYTLYVDDVAPGFDLMRALSEQKASEQSRYQQLQKDLVAHFGYFMKTNKANRWLRR